MRHFKDSSKKTPRAWSLSPAILNDLFLTQKGSGAEETETSEQVDAEASAPASQAGLAQAGSAQADSTQQAGTPSFPMNARVPSLGTNVVNARVRAGKTNTRPPVEGPGRGGVVAGETPAALGSGANPSASVVRGGRAHRRPVVFLLGLLVGAGFVLAGILFSRNGEECDSWKVVYTGCGDVACDGGAVNLHSMPAAQKGDTHAAPVVAKADGLGTVGAIVKTTS